MKKVLKKRNDVSFRIVLFPLRFHKDAKRKAESIWCAKSMEMLEDSFAKKPVPDPTCETDVIDSNIALANKLGITGTPAIIFSDGRMVNGFIDADKILELLEQ
jgi:thiol:disulfide interchange protein DsbC